MRQSHEADAPRRDATDALACRSRGRRPLPTRCSGCSAPPATAPSPGSSPSGRCNATRPRTRRKRGGSRPPRPRRRSVVIDTRAADKNYPDDRIAELRAAASPPSCGARRRREARQGRGRPHQGGQEKCWAGSRRRRRPRSAIPQAADIEAVVDALVKILDAAATPAGRPSPPSTSRPARRRGVEGQARAAQALLQRGERGPRGCGRHAAGGRARGRPEAPSGA